MRRRFAWAVVAALVALVAGPAGADRLLSVGADGVVKMWDPAGEQPPAALLQVPAAEARLSAVSPDGKLLALAGAGRSIRLFSLPDAKPLRTLEGPEGGVAGLSFSTDSLRVVAAGADAAVRLWNASDGQSAMVLKDAHPPGALVALASDSLILTAGKDDVLALWDAKGARQFTIETDHLAGLSGAIGSIVAQRAFTWAADGQVKIWSAGGFHELPDDARAPIRAAALSPDGARFWTAGADGKVSGWDPVAEKRTARFVAHGGKAVDGLAVSSDGKWVATGGADRAVRLWNAADAKPGRVWADVHVGAVRAVHFIPETPAR